mgnify:CR=1 FL=1
MRVIFEGAIAVLMMSVDIDCETMAKVRSILHKEGMSLSSAILLFLTKIADEGGLPFASTSPNEVTQAAILEALKRASQSFQSVDDLLADLNLSRLT